MYINISYDEGIQEDSNIEAVIRKVCDEVSRVYGLEEDEMSILLCDNAKIHKLNKEYRGIDRPTEYCPLPSMKGMITKVVKRNITYLVI